VLDRAFPLSPLVFVSPPLALPPVGGIECEEVLVLVPPPPPAERETGLDKVVSPPPLPAAPAAPPAPPVPTVKVKVSPDVSDGANGKVVVKYYG